MKALFGSAVLFCAACGSPGAEVSPVGAAGRIASPLSAGPATLVFNSNWTTQVYGELSQGATVNLQYALDRLPGCAAGQWTVTAFFQANRGAVGSTVVASTAGAASHPSFVIPSDPGDDLAVWFNITNSAGCAAWDSAFGANYHFSLQSYPVLQFNGDWTQSIDGLLPGASGVLIEFDLSRLPRCRATLNGGAVWSTIAWYSWDGSAAQSEPVVVSQGMSLVAASPLLLVPSGAKQLALWFENSDDSGCLGWDSAYGANYNYGFE